MQSASVLTPNPLQRLVLLRWIEVASQLLVLAFATLYLRIELPLPPLIAVSVALAAFNVFTVARQRQPKPVTETELLGQLAVDVVALAILLYFSGGATNPFASLFLLPLTIAAATLPAVHAWAMAALTLGAYSLLMVVNVPMPPPSNELAQLDHYICTATGVKTADPGETFGFGLHVLGMWLNFLLSALIVAFFVGRMASALRAREQELARAREAALRNEQILALGTLAAGAAHQLGTPLSTMAVVIRELELQYGSNLELAPDLSLMRQQIDSCKAILSQLVDAAGYTRGEDGQGIALDAYLDRIVDEWRVLRPAAKVTKHLAASRSAPRILADRTLEYAVLNLLNNAADASPEGVEVCGTWDDSQCTVDILDRGPGLDASVAPRIGQPFYTTKTDLGGMGIGVFLSNATVERYGGKVELTNREGGGARTRIHLPLKRLLVEP